MLILLFLLVDVGLIIWAWHLYQKKQEQYDSSGFAYQSAPVEIEALAAPEPKASVRSKDGVDYLIKEDRGQSRQDRRIESRRTQPVSAAVAQRRRKVFKATSFYYDLKNSPRFKNSKLAREWKADFLSYPDLKAVNDAYQKDRDAVKFMVNMAKSPNFSELLKNHFSKPETKEFISKMTKSKAVQEAASVFKKDTNIDAMIRNLGLANEAREAAQSSPPAKKSQAPIEVKSRQKLEMQESLMKIQRQ